MDLFCCPVCGSALVQKSNLLRCAKGHCFDVAREGYVHLLTADKMHAKAPGDNKEMVAARHSFLQAGAYAPFADKLSELLCTALADVPSPCVLDAGCGEGYYTAHYADALQAKGLQRRIAAFDISKFAVKEAAKHIQPDVRYAVASSFSIPVANGGMHALVNVFSPMAEKEFARVLRPDGLLVFAVPGPRHLFGLKQVLYENPYENAVQDIAYEGFVLEQRVPVQDTITVDKAQIRNLFAMTPYYWKTSKAGAEKLEALESLTTEIHFDFLLYRRQKQKKKR